MVKRGYQLPTENLSCMALSSSCTREQSLDIHESSRAMPSKKNERVFTTYVLNVVLCPNLIFTVEWCLVYSRSSKVVVYEDVRMTFCLVVGFWDTRVPTSKWPLRVEGLYLWT